MTDAADIAEEKPPAPAKTPGRRWRQRIVTGLALAFLLLVGAGVLLRLGVATDPGRALVMRLADGAELGPFGRLRLYGLKGDLLRDFTLARATVTDTRGIWLDARDLSMRWRSGELLARRFHAESIRAGSVVVLRRPEVKPQPPSKPRPLPVGIRLDQLRLRLETRPAFSVRPGLWDLDARADIARSGAAEGRLDAQSRLHAGDGVAAVFSFGGGRTTRLNADAVEAQGGALAGALGLAADQRLAIKAVARGTADGAAELDLDTVSGALHPLRAHGAWSRGGARLDAAAALGASRFTRPLLEKVGPEARLVLTARQTRGDLYAIDAAVAAREASVHAAGPLDWKRRSTPGLQLDLAVRDASRWLSQPALGPVRAAGALSGDIERFRYAARLDAQRFAQSGYALARIAGPLTLSRDGQEWRAQGDLAGADGAGKGLAFALLGAAPRARFDASRLKDGRLLIRDLRASGSGLLLQASGGQGLLGGLSFKGDATLTNLAAAQKGARGAVKAAWSAGQARGAKAWDFTLDGRAAGFASGMAEADRLLGAAPRLTVKGAYGPGGLSLARADLTGAKLSLGARGTLAPAGVLAMALDYRASGPFAAGPVEIAGEVKGTGALAGTLTAPRADLKADFASIDFGRLVVTPAHLDLALAKGAGGIEGRAALAGPSRYGRAQARTGFRFAGSDVVLDGLAADAGGVQIKGSAALKSGVPSTADLTFAAGPGAFLTRGRLTGSVKLAERPGGAVADLTLNGADLAAPELPVGLKSVRLAAAGPLSRLPFQLAAESVDQTPFKLAGSGVFAQTGAVTEVSLQGAGRLRKADIRTLEPAVFRLSPGDRSARLRLAVGGGTAVVSARQQGDGLDARADLGGVGLAAFQEDFVGKISGVLTLNGRGAHLGGQLNAALEGARSRDAPENLALTARVQAALADSRLHVDAGATNAQGLQSLLSLDLPAEAAAQPFRIAINRTKPIAGRFSAAGELRPLWDLLAGGDQTLSGRLDARGTVAGTLSKPEASGRASLAGGRLQDVTTGLNLEKLDVQAVFDQAAVNVRQFSGADGHGGTVSGEGRVGLAAGSGSSLQLSLKRFQLLDNDLGRASTSGTVTVTRDPKGLARLVGKLVIDRAEISPVVSAASGVVGMDVVEINLKDKEGGALARPKAASASKAVGLDVALTAPRGIYIRGKGLDLELSLDAHVGGSTARPDLSGVARVVRGSYDFAGKRFDFDENGEVRLAASADAIRLNLRAVRNDPTLTAVVRVTGTATRPEIALTSTPVLPQDEVLSQVLFGQSAAQLSAAEAAQLASALASLSGGRGFDLIGGLRQFARLDRLAIGGDQQSGTTVSGGKYITNNIYVELTGGARTGPSAQVELRVRRNLSLVSSVAPQGDTRLSVRFRKDFR